LKKLSFFRKKILLSYTLILVISFFPSSSKATFRISSLLEEGLMTARHSLIRKPIRQFSSSNKDNIYQKLIEQINDGREKASLLEDIQHEHSKECYARHIPHFKGAVYKEGDRGYETNTKQYATTSYPKEKMSPFLISYPKDNDDIISAINFAKKENKYIVARSGGHQYTGKSSGGEDTIVLAMDYFKKLQKKQNSDDLVEVGPSVKLRDLNKELTKWQLSVPHGECPLVGIGGHAQTGGYGHFLRSFGLNADYVQDFDIILADGKSYTITRPKPNDNNLFNQEIFRGVLSGNAGSFGIVTRYTYKPIKDVDHPESYGFVQTRKYKTSVFKNVMEEVKNWTMKIGKGEDDQALRGLDFMMSLENDPFSQYGLPLSLFPDLMAIELVYSDPDKNVPYQKQFQSIIDKTKQDMGLEDRVISDVFGDFEGKKRLSELAHHFVRRWPQVTLSGREFSLPYKKRINVTMNELTDEFVDAFTKKVDESMDEKKVHMVFQMAFGGGAYRSKGNDVVDGLTVTSFPNRKFVWNFVYDLFYEPGKEQRAIDLQNEMQVIVDNHFNKDKQEKRFFWGTFGNTKMSQNSVQKMYYDDAKQYRDLQMIKEKYDPSNIFHTDLTIQLPQK